MPIDTETIADFVQQVRSAAETRTPLRFRGGGSKDFYGQSFDGQILDTRPLSGVVSYEPSELVVTVGAGTSLAELEALLAAQGQCLPFEPPHFNRNADGVSPATVGGMLAAGLSGPARASAGAVRDFVLGLQIINGRAEHLTFGGQVMKNVAGYDVSRLMNGSMGTLALLTEISLKVLPIAPAEATLMFSCDQAQALAWLHGWGAKPLPLNASCWMEQGGQGRLYLRLRGAQAAVAAACKTLGGERMADAAASEFWLACRDQRLAWFEQRTSTQDLWRLSLPQTAAVLLLPESCSSTLVEWHGGQRWICAEASDAPRLRELAAMAGGHATLFKTALDRPVSAVQRFDTLQPALARIQAGLRREFDPIGIFNPERAYLKS